MSHFDNPFVLPANQYKRDLDVFKHYVDQSAVYLSAMSGAPRELCLAFVKNNLRPDGEFPFKDPAVMYLRRSEHGDREQVEGTLGG